MLTPRALNACDSASEYCNRIDVAWEDPASSAQPLPAALTMLGLRLGYSNLRDLRNKFGRTQILHRDECGGKEFCFESSSGEKPVTLIVDVWGNRLRSFVVLGDRLNDNRCVTSSLVRSTLATDDGLRLGMSSVEVERILGKPNKLMPDAIAYSFEARTRMTNKDVRALQSHWPRAEIVSDPFWNVWSIIAIGLHNSQVRCFRVQTTRTW